MRTLSCSSLPQYTFTVILNALLLGCLGLVSATTMAPFSEIIPYQFFAEDHDDYGHPRESGRNKDEIAFAYIHEKSFVTGSIKDLLPTFDTMCHILRYIMNPKAGDSHNLRSSMLDVFTYIRDIKKVDVLDFMFYELHQCVAK